jgi:SAM-dependent methyltransferase
MDDDTFTEEAGGLYLPTVPIQHREHEYDPAGFETLRAMQARHFWYRGRHRFLFHALQQSLRHLGPPCRRSLSAIDLGAGCGGWVAYLQERMPHLFAELTLGDSSLHALRHANTVVRPGTKRYQIDLRNLPWDRRWDVAFLLDVLEHIPEDLEVLRQTHKTLRPGGLLLVTTPALKLFWTYNDTVAGHVRRYSHADFARLARRSGFRLCRSRYFMFFLSPLLLLSRLRRPRLESMSRQQILEHVWRTHQVPAPSLNAALELVFSRETPVGWRFPFPWGTSILGVFQKAS